MDDMRSARTHDRPKTEQKHQTARQRGQDGTRIQEPSMDIAEPHPTARLAQLAERKALNLVVVGSSPTVGVSSCLRIAVLRQLLCMGVRRRSRTFAPGPEIPEHEKERKRERERERERKQERERGAPAIRHGAATRSLKGKVCVCVCVLVLVCVCV